MNYFVFSFVLVIFFSSCQEDDSPRVYRLKKIDSPKVVNQPVIQKSKTIFWEAESNWIEVSGNTMRLASYQIPYDNGFADLSVTKFPGEAGGIESNVNRWRKQLDLNEQTLAEINRSASYFTNSIGEFSVYKLSNNEKPELAFLCMILPVGNSTLFVKLNTTISGINNLEKTFINFCKTFKIVE